MALRTDFLLDNWECCNIDVVLHRVSLQIWTISSPNNPLPFCMLWPFFGRKDRSCKLCQMSKVESESKDVCYACFM